CAPVLIVVEDGRIVCLAHSSRRREHACARGHDTRPAARRRGYALAATVLWAEAVAAEGREPFYSALAENSASLALAHAAGYRPFAHGVSVES
ncbi:MAG: GNAT family N-acetyltransferase, partial [Ktedonobacterales bacterium]